MKRYLFLFAISVCVISAQGQVNLWDEVTELEQQSLPASALNVVNRIYQEALNNGNTPELIKALVFQLKYETAIDSDVFPDRIREIERLAHTEKDPVGQAVLYSLSAQLYTSYYQSDRYSINQRTAITGDAPEDLREWTTNLFIRKVAELVELSVYPASELQQTDISTYREILLYHGLFPQLRPTMYDFLQGEGIQTLNQWNNTESNSSVLKLYEQWLDFRTSQEKKAPTYDNRMALLMVELDRLEYRQNKLQDNTANEEYIQALKALEEQYQNDDFCVEIAYRMALYYNSQWNSDFNSRNESLRKAYEILRNGIEKYPEYKRIGLLQNLLFSITQSNFNISSTNAVYPNQNLELTIRYQNTPRLTIEIYKIAAPVTAYADIWNRRGQYQKSGTHIETHEVELENSTPYLSLDTIIRIPVKELGNYEYVIYANEDTKEIVNQQFSVSRLATIARTVDGKREYLVTDRMSGKPIRDAELRFYTRKNNVWEVVQFIRTDKYGLATSDNPSDISFYQASDGNDVSLILSPVPWIPTTRTNDIDDIRFNLFTDRSIYRPGQIVHFKGIVSVFPAQDPEQGRRTLSNQNYTVIFSDANEKEIANKILTTNEFGSISGEFVIPQGVMNGMFSLRIGNNNRTNIRVEEYKRPSFDIQFLPNEDTYRFGDTVTVKGSARTFSGINLQNTDVQYNIIRKTNPFFRVNYTPDTPIANGSVKTNSDGSFEIRFPADKPVKQDGLLRTNCVYEIEATVTDSNGETQSSTSSIYVGDQALFLYIKTSPSSQIFYKEQPTDMVVYAVNSSRQPISVSGTYDMYHMEIQDSRLDWNKENWNYQMWNDEDWTPDKKILSGQFQSGENLDTRILQSLPSGRYRIVAKAKDNQGREEEIQFDFTLCSKTDKRPPVPMIQWLVNLKDTCNIGETAEIIFGSSVKDVYVLYEITTENKRVHVSRFKLNNENKKIKIPFLESYGNGITVMFSFIKNGKFFSQQALIYKRPKSQKLNLYMEVFRDHLLPGQSEEWKLSVKDENNRPVAAEVLAAMYDASLDKLQNHGWYFNPVRWTWFNDINNHIGSEFGYSYTAWRKEQLAASVPFPTYDTFDWFDFNMIRNFSGKQMLSRAAETSSIMATGAIRDGGVYIADLIDNEVVLEEPRVYNHAEILDFTPPAQQTIEIRQNFNETAFFYPQLRTNEAGETLIAFTVPESNTTWKFMGLAHTTDLKFGQIVREAISQKKLMVTPNIPRFLRSGDRATILSNISNLTDKTMSGTATINFFDPATNQNVIAVADRSIPFTIEAGQTLPVSWTFDVPDSLDFTAVRIVAVSPDFSDGEQHLLPILPNRILVTESLPLNVLGEQTRTFSLTPLFGKKSPTLEDYRVTLEFASNPVWYAVQALPTLSTPQTENVLSWFAAYYINTLAAQIARNTPNIQQMIEVWTKQAGNPKTLLSDLEKNQELKALLLEETPWVLEAENESAQKQRLISLFDENRIQYLNTQALEKLQSLQTGDGGWSWFKGMGSSFSITQWILYSMASICPDDRSDMIINAIQFIDRQYKKRFDDFKKYNSEWKQSRSFSIYDLEYLLVRSYYKDVPFDDAEEAVRFYTGIVEKNWNRTTDLYGRALAAIIIQRNGNTSTAQSILKSLREHATRKPDLGMYWANNNTYSFMTQSAVCVHTFIMEAFREAGGSPSEMDEMKLWLLSQKQTQTWESVPATVNAIDMLLKTGSDWLKSSNEVSISIDEKPLDLGPSEPGTGYFKISEGLKILDSKKLSISKPNPGPAYGALYRQYFEDLDKITSAKTGLNVEKSFITPNDGALQVGDKVTIRLTVRTDRDLEYVLLKDLRASCFEPADQISSVQWKQGLMYYQSPKDASMNFFFSALPKGTYVFEYPVYVTAPGDYSNGITTIQCMYAPQFVSHTAGQRIKVE